MKSDLDPTTASTTRRAQRLHALGDPIRLAIVDLLVAQDLSPDALAAALKVPGNLLAHHLKVLQAADIVTRSPSQSDRRRTYVRLVRESLDGLLPAPMSIEASRIVFVCTHNSARSVLAEALWRATSDVPAASAGTHPAARFNPRARAVARRAGIAFPTGSPQALGDVLNSDDVVVSVCDAVNEELDPSATPHLHWSIPDPSRVGTDAAFEQAMTEISRRVAELSPRIHYRRPTPPRRRRT